MCSFDIKIYSYYWNLWLCEECLISARCHVWHGILKPVLLCITWSLLHVAYDMTFFLSMSNMSSLLGDSVIILLSNLFVTSLLTYNLFRKLCYSPILFVRGFRTHKVFKMWLSNYEAIYNNSSLTVNSMLCELWVVVVLEKWWAYLLMAFVWSR